MPTAAYPPPNVQPVANEPSIHAHSPIYSSLVNAGAPPPVATTLTAISGAESSFGKSPVGGVNRDGSRDYGYFQVNNKAWPQFGGPAVASLPLADQAKIAVHIWNTQGPKAWSTYTSGAYKNYLGAADKAAVAPPLPSTPAAQPAKPPPTVGSMLAGLAAPTGADGKGPSEIQQAGQAVGGGGQQSQPAAPEPDLRGQQAAAMGGQARQQQLAAMGQQSAAAMGARGGQPLTWGSAPPGSGYGPQTPPMTMGYWGGVPIPMPAHVVAPGAGAGQQIPGTTLNSIGAV